MRVPSKIRSASHSDAPQIAAIYDPYVVGASISFEEQLVSFQGIEQRMTEIGDASLPYLVLENAQSTVIGYAYARKWKGRCAYNFTVETSIYLAKSAAGKGLGAQLYRALLDQLRERKIHVAIAGIVLPNKTSIALHEKLGFERVARFREESFKFENWKDVGYWQLFL